MSTLLIRNGYILDPLHDHGWVEDLRHSDILINDGIISGVGSFAAETADSTIEASGKLVIPGLISAHTHATTTFDRALVDNCPLDPWMLYVVNASMSMTPRDTYVATALAAVELLESGTTALFDLTSVSPAVFDEKVEAVVTAFQDVGIRAVVAPSVSDLPFSKTLPLHIVADLTGLDHLDIRPLYDTAAWLDGCRGFLRRWHGKDPLTTCSLGLSGPHRCSPEVMEGVSELVHQYQTGLQTHVYETKSQWIAAQRMFPRGMLRHMHEIGLLGPRTSLAHCVWLAEEDIDLIEETGTTVVHNPISNVRIGSGVAPVHKMRDKSIVVALGADGPGSGDKANMFEVVKCAALIHKLYGPRETWLRAGESLNMCLAGGAAVLGQPIGALRPGYRADISILRMDHLFKMPKEHMIRQLAYSELGSSVETVLVDGRTVVSGGSVVTVDAAALHAEAQEIVSRIYADLPRRDALFNAADGLIGRMLAAVDGYKTPHDRLVQMK
ncbi:MAG: amidohydrolase family protein [Chloroflexi bacterium]|nr:amidohydrolase family protein [Chloroflexota bacterium]